MNPQALEAIEYVFELCDFKHIAFPVFQPSFLHVERNRQHIAHQIIKVFLHSLYSFVQACFQFGNPALEVDRPFANCCNKFLVGHGINSHPTRGVSRPVPL